MAQHDYEILNQTFVSYRNDHNNSLSAIVSKNSGATEPSTTYAYQWWYDTANNILKIRNADNDAWINFASFDQTNDNFSLTVARIFSPSSRPGPVYECIELLFAFRNEDLNIK